jgi:hypothetical protein
MSFVNNAENPNDSLLQMLEKKERFCSKFDFTCVLQGTVFKNDVSDIAKMISLFVE